MAGDTLQFYLVRSRDGKYLHRKGYGGYSDSWSKDILKARVYTKIGQARAQVTWWANAFPKYGVATIVRFEAKEAEVIDESKRVKQRNKKCEERELAAEKREAKRQLKAAEARLARAERGEVSRAETRFTNRVR